ncbi:MAG: 1,4-alpha-glucan branching protein GlgB [Clostridiales bacterium]|nr:1,4-alpha-glucan branching protein GlgB [Clostridiales bacterium]
MARNTTDYPIYLFNEGTNSKAYNFFRPQYVVKNRKKVWRFRVWAPNAISVSVVGDFNNWDREANPMKKISATGIWEAFVRNAKRYDVYKFSIECSDHQIRYKADPYATHAETAPANGSKIYDISNYKWRDAEYMAKRKTINHYQQPMNIYEMHLGSWRVHDDGNYYSYRDLAESLVPYLKEMGYTHVEILPVTEHPYDGSWGYQSTGFFAPTSRYGTPHDFMYFVDKCHEYDIGVIMDFVVSHFPKDAFGLYEFDGTCLYEYNDTYKQEHKGWGTRVFDYNKPQVRSFLISAVNFWMEYYHIDGMRLDAVASMLYLNYDRKEGEWQPNEFGGEYNLEAIYFLQTLNKTILSNYPDVIMIAEESTAFPMVTMPPDVGGLGFNYKWNMGWMNDTLSYVKLDPFFRKGSHDKLTFGISYAFNENYILPFSHDEVVHGKSSMIGKVPGSYEEKFAGLKTVMSYQMAHPGKKLNFMGNEFGQFIEWDYHKQLDWLLLDYPSHRLFRNYIKDLNFLYLKNKPMYELDSSYNGFRWIVVDDKIQNVIIFSRYDKEKNQVICIMNFSTKDRENYEFGVERAGEYIEALNSDCVIYGGTTEPGIKHKTIKKPNHNHPNTLSVTIKGNSAIFLKKI